MSRRSTTTRRIRRATLPVVALLALAVADVAVTRYAAAQFIYETVEEPEDPATRFRVEGDATVTDTKTGLVWELKCDCPGSLHDGGLRVAWSGDGRTDTVWDWIERVNDARLGGKSDWRVPNVKELYSIVDPTRQQPALFEVFGGRRATEPCTGAVDPACAVTEVVEYWTSTTFSDFTAHALVVGAKFGLVDDRTKSGRFGVRAVRGGRLP